MEVDTDGETVSVSIWSVVVDDEALGRMSGLTALTFSTSTATLSAAGCREAEGSVSHSSSYKPYYKARAYSEKLIVLL